MSNDDDLAPGADGASPPTITVSDREISQVLESWLDALRRAGVELVVLEGLPNAGETTALAPLRLA